MEAQKSPELENSVHNTLAEAARAYLKLSPRQQAGGYVPFLEKIASVSAGSPEAPDAATRL